MKQSIGFLFFLLFSIMSNAQLTKGNWIVGGNGSFSSAKYGGNNTTSYTQTLIQISPIAGYFVLDKLAVGLKPGYTYTNSTFGTVNYALNTFSVGPFVRYYFLETDKRVNILTEASYQYTISKVRENPSSSTNGFSFSAGPVVYFNPSVGLEFTIGYSTIKSTSSSDFKNTILLGVGLQVHLEKADRL